MLAVLQETFWERLSGVLALKSTAYEGIRRDANATREAWWIVLLLGLSQGIALVTTPFADTLPGLPEETAQAAEEFAALFPFETTDQQVLGIVASIVGAVLTWYLTSWLLKVIGGRWTGKTTSVSAVEMRRLVAWGYAPSLARYLLPIPLIGPPMALVGWLWSFVTGVMAVRAAFGVGIIPAIVIRVAAFLASVVIVVAAAAALATLVYLIA